MEYAVCEDMVKLLPLKLEKLHHELEQETQNQTGEYIFLLLIQF